MKNNALYDKDVIIVKRYGEIDRIIYLSSTTAIGAEIDRSNRDKNDAKLSNNIIRAKSKIQEYALCNDWEYFCTLTVSPDKFDRYNLKAIYKDFSKWLKNRYRDTPIKYLIVPEQHKNGAWHFHGLLTLIPSDEITLNQYGYPTWDAYSQRFGFANVDKIKDPIRIAHYITKYITKDLGKSIEKGDHLFYASHGLKSAVTIYRGYPHLRLGFKWDYEKDDGTYKCFTYNNKYTDFSEFFD